jgi:virginiamycin B lyase
MKPVHLGLLAVVLLASTAQAQQCRSYPRMTGGGQEIGPVRAPDGAMWYLNSGGNRLVRMDENFQETPFVPVNGTSKGLSGMAFDGVGNVWYSKSSGSVGKFPMAGGEGVEYDLPKELEYAKDLVRGPDGAMWFYDPVHSNVGRVGADGSVTVVPPPPKLNPNFSPNAVARGVDNSLWFTDNGTNALWKLDITTLKYRRYDIPEPGAHPWELVVGKDGTVWFTMRAARKFGRMTPNGVFSSISVVQGGVSPSDVHQDDHGNIWLNDIGGNLIRIKPDGSRDQFKCPGMNHRIAMARDGSIWGIGGNEMKVLRMTSTDAPRVAATGTVTAPTGLNAKGKVPNITLAELRKLFDDKTRRIVVHYTVWENKGCGYCDGSFAIFDDFASRNAGKATFVRVAAEYNDPMWRDPWLAKHAPMKGIPTFITYYDQSEVARVDGRLSAAVLNARLLPAM